MAEWWFPTRRVMGFILVATIISGAIGWSLGSILPLVPAVMLTAMIGMVLGWSAVALALVTNNGRE